MAFVCPMLLATAFSTAFAADSPLVGAWQLDPGQSGQAAPDIADMSKATAGELRAVWGPLLANAGTYEISFPHRRQDADAEAGAERGVAVD